MDASSATPRGPVVASSREEEAAFLAHVRNRVIGADVMIGGPFGEKPLRYFDFIASGRFHRAPYGHLLLHIDEERSKSIRHRLDEGHLGEKPGWVRISLSPTVSEDEFQALLEGVDHVARRGRELAAGYTLDDETGEWTRRAPVPTFANGKETP